LQKRVHAFYSGSVQGVGFRFTSEELASSLGITGWVKNLHDGRVEILGEGDEKKLQAFLDKIAGIFNRYIESADVLWEDATGEFDGFDVKF